MCVKWAALSLTFYKDYYLNGLSQFQALLGGAQGTLYRRQRAGARARRASRLTAPGIGAGAWTRCPGCQARRMAACRRP